MFDIIRNILICENGATAIECGFYAALAATVGGAALLAMSSFYETFFTGAAGAESFTLTHVDGGGLRG